MYNQRHWRGNRQRHRAAYGFPWMIFFVIAFFSHSSVGIALTLMVAVGLSIFLAILFNARSSWRSTDYQQPFQTPQYSPPGRYSQGHGQDNQQQYPVVYQRPQEVPYQAYEQGYSAPRIQERVEEPQRQQNALSGDAYQEYEQPRTLYPEQLPPMQQQ